MDHSDTDSFHDVRVAGQRGANNDQSRSNSLMSETSSQPDIHPFYKVRAIQIILGTLAYRFLTEGPSRGFKRSAKI
jgi:hypothetical protein